MANERTAEARLGRLLHVLPAAMRDGGAELSGLAAALGTTTERVLEDLDELTNRAYYRPGGWPDDVQILVEAGRVRVHRADGFERPVRLTREETLCLALALRGGAAAGRLSDSDRRVALLRRAEAHLGRGAPDGPDPATRPDTVAAPDRDPDPEGIRETLMWAARERRPCALWYVKSGARDGSVRVVHPYAIAYGEGAWYVVAHCTVEDGVRVFRLDRVLTADLADGTFTVPADFDVDAYVQGGRVYHAEEHAEVRVRYSSKIARWVRERAEWEAGLVEEAPDGAFVVQHRVADPHWAVGHALLYGGEAEVIEPAEVRRLVRAAMTEVLADS
jgi:proteasome accessory factor C